ncbi:MAG: FAD-dependent oxidoreductase [Burkholderiales bacterium]|nr:FAD-dependent oxidoreductase [Burkholderiales bacterium]
MTISRRTFLSVGSASVALPLTQIASAMPLEALGKDPKWTDTVNVLVIGGGLSGLCASIEARECGAEKVLLLEKGAFLGGHALISGGGYVASGTKIQKDAGIEDSAENDWQDAVKRGLALNSVLKTDTRVARMIFEEQAPALEWLQKQGVKFEEKPGYGYGNAHRLHYFAPQGPKGNSAAIQALVKRAEEVGVKCELNTKLCELITETDRLGSPVVGVVAETKDGQKICIKATCGVVLASGGFGRNPEMIKRYHPYLEGIQLFSSPNATGDGLKAALDIGAQINITHNDLGGTFASSAVKDPKIRINGFGPSNMPLLIVGKDGKRFIDESRGGRYISVDMVTSKNFDTFWIFDKKGLADAEKWFKPLFSKEGIVGCYNTLEELAKAQGIDWENLKRTVEIYNEDVKTGKDREFGKSKLFSEICEAPYYVFEAQPVLLYTYTGLLINTKTEVLDTRDRPIPGLFAAGDLAGRWDAIVGLGQGGMSGLGLATVTGRKAGREATMRCRRA